MQVRRVLIIFVLNKDTSYFIDGVTDFVFKSTHIYPCIVI